MILSPQTLLQPKNKIQSRKPLVSVVSNQILFNKSAIAMIDLSLRYSFETTDRGYLLMFFDKEGFQINPGATSFAINSRQLIKELELFTMMRKPKFYISKFDNKFILTTLKNETITV